MTPRFILSPHLLAPSLFRSPSVCATDFPRMLIKFLLSRHQAYLSIGNKYGKGFRQPEVRHAFYAPTKLHYYPEGSYPQFDRNIPSGSHPQLFGGGH